MTCALQVPVAVGKAQWFVIEEAEAAKAGASAVGPGGIVLSYRRRCCSQVHVLTNMSLRLTTQRPKSSQRRRCMLPSGVHWQLGCWDWARCLPQCRGGSQLPGSRSRRRPAWTSLRSTKAAAHSLSRRRRRFCGHVPVPVRIGTCQCRQQPRDQQGAGDAMQWRPRPENASSF